MGYWALRSGSSRVKYWVSVKTPQPQIQLKILVNETCYSLKEQNFGNNTKVETAVSLNVGAL
jgi:hypothetical protein